MPSNKMSPSNMNYVWRKVNSLRAKIPHGRVKCNVGDLVRTTKQKVAFAKGYQEIFLTEIFRVLKVITRVPQPVYKLPDLQDRGIEGQFYSCELAKFTYHLKLRFK